MPVHSAERKLPIARFVLVCAIFGAVLPTRPQSPSASTGAGDKKTFDVASVKQNLAGYPPGGPPPHSNFPLDSGDAYVETGGLFNATNWPIWSYIGFAYKMTPAELDALRAQLPPWAVGNKYDVEARAEGDPTKDDMRTMLRALLADRFKLAVHSETRQISIYDLELEKPGHAGPQLQPHSDDRPCYGGPGAADPSPNPSANAPALVPCGTMTLHLLPVGRFRVEARAIRMASVADYMKSQARLDRPVRDKTGLHGIFDYTLEWTPEGPVNWNGAAVQLDETGPTFLEALKEQLGLKLVATTGPLDRLVIDRIEQPSAN